MEKLIYSYAFISIGKMEDISFTVAAALNSNGKLSYKASVSADGEVNIDATVNTFLILHDPRLAVDMPYGISPVNANGWLRSDIYYFRKLLCDYPQAFSEKNRELVSRGCSPVIDSHFSAVFPQFAPFENMELIHHHIGEGGQAVAIPKSFHIGSGGIHNIEKQLGISAAESDFSEYYKANFCGTDTPIRIARESFLQERFGEDWKGRLSRINNSAYHINNPQGVISRRAENAEIRRVLSVPSAYASDATVHIENLNILAELIDGMSAFECGMTQITDELERELFALGRTYLDEGYDILKVKVIELKRKIREHCNISAVTRKKLEEKVENIKRQIHIAAE